MKAQARPAQGSFGIPDEMIEAASRSKKAAQAKRKTAEEVNEHIAPPPEQTENPPSPEDKKLEGNKALVDEVNPIKVLKNLGAEFGEDDLHKLLFNGYFEADVEVIKGHFNATIRTLTGSQYDEIDELLGQDIENLSMTREGFENRKVMWNLSYGVTKLHGRSILKDVLDKAGEPDSMATAKAKRKVLAALSSQLLNQLIQIHGTLVTAVILIAKDPDLLKNS